MFIEIFFDLANLLASKVQGIIVGKKVLALLASLGSHVGAYLHNNFIRNKQGQCFFYNALKFYLIFNFSKSKFNSISKVQTFYWAPALALTLALTCTSALALRSASTRSRTAL